MTKLFDFTLKPSTFKYLLLGLALLTTSGCGTKTNGDKVKEAQQCLNTSTPASAPDCLEKITGLESEAAYLIRCAALFIQQGFATPATIATAADSLKGGSSTSSTAAAMTVLAFNSSSSQATNYTNSNLAVTYCTLSKSKGLTMLASLAQMATAANYVKNTISACTAAADMNAQLACMKTNADTTTKTAVGTAVLSAYNANCAGPTVTASYAQACTQFNTATGNGSVADPAAIGQLFLNQY